MKVHFILPQLTPFYGMERAAGLLMLALKSAGVTVSGTVISGDVPESMSHLNIDQLQASRRLTRLAEVVPRLRRTLMELPSDVHLVASGLWAAVPVAAALVRTSRSYTAWEHSVLPPRLEMDRRVGALFSLVQYKPFRPGGIVAVSRGVAETAAGALQGIPVEVIPNVIDEGSPPAIISGSGGTRNLLSTGAFRKYKNYSCALYAMRELPQQYTLKMAGDGPERKNLEKLAASLELNERVQFLGRVRDVVALLHQADALVHPSLSETFGFSLIEASQQHTPVVVLPSPNLSEIVPKYVPGVISQDQTGSSFARAVRSLFEESGPNYIDFKRAASERVDDFGAPLVARRWISSLENLSTGRR